MNKHKFPVKLFFICLMFLASVAGAQQSGERIQFVACPIVRDTASVPCWLTRHKGTMFYMGIQSDVSAEFQPPLQGHQVLVEGVVGSEQICGGIVLEEIKISTMPELNGSCNTMLPAEDRYVIDFNPRPPGPSGGRLAFQANIDPLPPARPSREEKTFDLFFDFDRTVSFRHPRELMAILEYANDIGASRVEVTGHFASHLLSNGQVLTESPGAAERRAREIATLLEGAGLDAEFEVHWSEQPQAGDGHEDWRGRHAQIVVIP